MAETGRLLAWDNPGISYDLVSPRKGGRHDRGRAGRRACERAA
jgi:hypothetical protein